MRTLIRKIPRSITCYPEMARQPRRCGSDLAKCLRPERPGAGDENWVNKTLSAISKRRGGEAAVTAAGADDQGGGIARRKALRLHEHPVIGRTLGRKVNHRFGDGGARGDRQIPCGARSLAGVGL